MTQRINPQFDPRPVDELVAAALSEQDEDLAWDAVSALHWRGSHEVLHKSETLCQSECDQERKLGADILGQLGVPERAFPQESRRLLFSMLESESHSDVLQAIFVAFSHLGTPSVIPLAARCVGHPDSDVRHAVVLAISGHEDDLAVDLLIALSNDLDSHVRDWATFALGSQIETDTPKIRNALAARLDDSDDDTRGEAMIGLAKRKDQRVIPAIQKDLATCVSYMAIEAASYLGSPALLPALVELRELPNVPPDFLDGAISDCTPNQSLPERCRTEGLPERPSPTDDV